jgi:cyanophycin synthetase
LDVIMECPVDANLSTGGTSRDVTDETHPDVVDLCQRAAAVAGLDVAGVDLRLPDIAAPLPVVAVGGESAGVIEVNAAPGLRMHLHPAEGPARGVAASIVDALYPPGDTGRIPTVAITGTNGKTTTARLHLLAGTGLRVGLTTTDGVYLGGRLVQRADATGPRPAQVVLGDPTVQAAVLETARGGPLRQGLGYDHSDVGVITNIGHDHLRQDGLDTVDDIVHVKALVAERVRDGGALVLNADDPWLRDLVRRAGVRAAYKDLVWFSMGPDDPMVARHRDSGGRAYLLADGWLVEAARSLDVPVPRGGGSDPVLYPWNRNPGRGMLLRSGDVFGPCGLRPPPGRVVGCDRDAAPRMGPGTLRRRYHPSG